jgi:hypothetical protein
MIYRVIQQVLQRLQAQWDPMFNECISAFGRVTRLTRRWCRRTPMSSQAIGSL